jgi:hypothetical protein
MKTATPTIAPKLKTPRKPEDCFDWLTEDQVVEMARRAFRLTCAATFPPEGESFILDLPGEPLRSRIWSNREGFEDNLASNFAGRLAVAAHLAGLKGRQIEAHRHQNYEQAIGFASSYPDVSTTHTGGQL